MKFFLKTLLFLCNLVFPSKIIGKENIPEGGAVIVYNHLSLLDSFFVNKCYGKNDMKYLAKKELFEKKFVGRLLCAYGGIAIDRDKPEIEVLIKCVRLLKNGNKLALSPEGTRNKTGSTDFLPFKPGAGFLAVKSKTPMIPIIVEKRAKIFRKTLVCIGKPFELSQFYDKKLSDSELNEINDIMRAEMKKTQSTLFEYKNLKKKK